MSDERTERQRDADKVLDAAIRETYAAYAEDDEVARRYLAEWMVIGTAVGADDEGQYASTPIMLPDGGDSIPHPHIVGMLRCAQLRIEYPNDESA